MDFTLFRKVVDDIERWNPARESIALYVFGEPFLYDRIYDCIDYVEDRLKKCKIFISTNFSTLNREKIERLFAPRIRNLNLRICIDSISPETYAKQRTGNYHNVFNNIDYLIDLKKRYDSEKPGLSIGIIITKDNRRERRIFLEFWKKKLSALKGVEVIYATSHDWAGQVSTDRTLLKKERWLIYKNICKLPFSLMTVFSNGDVGLCCMDVDHKINIGNAKYEDLAALWRGPKAEAFRNSMRSFALDSFNPCKDCFSYNAFLPPVLLKGIPNFIRRQFRSYF